MSIITNTPTTSSDFGHNFKSAKNTHPALEVYRASTALVHDVTGALVEVGINIPRIDYDPQNGQCRGLLIEGAATNLLTQNSTFGSDWSKTGMTIEDTDIPAPLAGHTAKRVRNTATTNQHWLHQNKRRENGLRYFGSIFVKYEEGGVEWVALDYSNYVYQANYGKFYFNLKTGEGHGIPARVIKYPNGWYRLIIETKIKNDGGSTVIDPETGDTVIIPDDVVRNTSPRIRALEPGQVENYLGNTSQTYLIWAAQDEQGEEASLPIITTTAAVTRAADHVRIKREPTQDITVVFSALMPLLNPDTDNSANRRRNFVNFSELNNIWQQRTMIYLINQMVSVIQTVNGIHHLSEVLRIGSHAKDGYVRVKFALTYNSASQQYSITCNGSNPIVINRQIFPEAMYYITLGAQHGGVRSLCGYLEKIAVFGESVSVAELSALSTLG